MLKDLLKLFSASKFSPKSQLGGKKRTPERLKVNTHHRLGTTTKAVFDQRSLSETCMLYQTGWKTERNGILFT